MASHLAKFHKGSSTLTDAAGGLFCQTLVEAAHAWIVYFEVSGTPPRRRSDQNAGDESSDLDASAALALLRQKKAAMLEGIEVVPDEEIRTVLPVFVRTGIDQYLGLFNRKALFETFWPDRRDPEYLAITWPSVRLTTRFMRTSPTARRE